MGHRRRDGAGHDRRVARLRSPRPTDTVGAGPLHAINQVGNVVRGVRGVRIHTHDDAASGPRDAHVQGGRGGAFRVVEQVNYRITAGVVCNHAAGAVVAHAVDDQHLEPITRVLV